MDTLPTDQPTLTMPDAAARLGIAPQTVRRRIKAGTLPAALVEGPRGPEYRIPESALAESGAADQPTLRTEQATLPTAPPDQPTLTNGKASLSNGQATLVTPREEEKPSHDVTVSAPDMPGPWIELVNAYRTAAERERARVDSLRDELREKDQAHATERAALLEDLRTQQARHAEETRELRVLLLRAQETLQAVTEAPRALPVEAQEPPRRWWQLFRGR